MYILKKWRAYIIQLAATPLCQRVRSDSMAAGHLCSETVVIIITHWVQVILSGDKLQGGISWVVLLLHLVLSTNTNKM